MFLDAFWEQTFSAALPAACEDCAAALRAHPRTKAMLPFPCSLGWLVSAFHKPRMSPARFRSGYSRGGCGIVNAAKAPAQQPRRGVYSCPFVATRWA